MDVTSVEPQAGGGVLQKRGGKAKMSLGRTGLSVACLRVSREAVLLSPTRELAEQSAKVLRFLLVIWKVRSRQNLDYCAAGLFRFG